MKLLLASKSPRRQQLITQLGFEVQCVTLNADETVAASLPADQVAEAIARKKADAFDRSALAPDQVLVTADTIVVVDGRVLGKPSSRTDAIAMLGSLSGRAHTVYTGVCLVCGDRQTSFTESTEVYFNHLEKSDIEWYVDNYSPYDKAGAYGVQEWMGMVAVSRIEGCFYNVMGLPTPRLYAELLRFCPEAAVAKKKSARPRQ
ncbi:MAG: septum formation protein Maf [Bacteroidales bacterium]|nr:septum formation protein Maf [Bacteroidales bacterium]